MPLTGQTQFTVNQTAEFNQQFSSMTLLASGQIVVTWTDYNVTEGDNDLSSIKARLFNVDGTAAGVEFLINQDATGGQLVSNVTALQSGGFAVTWQNLEQGSYGVRAFDAAGAAIMNQINIPGPDLLLGNGTSPKVAELANGTDLIVSYAASSNQDPQPNDALVARIQNYESLTPTVEIHAITSGTPAHEQDVSVTALASGGYTATWFGDGTLNIQTFSDSGTPLVGSLQQIGVGAMISLDFTDQRPVIKTLSDGKVLVMWSAGGTSSDGSGSGVKAVLYKPTGGILGTFDINSAIADNQSYPHFVEFAPGQIVATWRDGSPSGDGDLSSIKAQIFAYDDTGLAPQGAEFVVNQQPVGEQFVPTVAATGNGGFAISWSDYHGPRILPDNSVTTAGDVQIRFYTTGANFDPEITSSGGGDSATFDLAAGATFVVDASALDANPGDTLQWYIDGGNDAGLFNIDINTGVLSFQNPALVGSYDVDILVDDGNSGFDVQNLTINVTNDAPVITSSGGGDTATIIVGTGGTTVTDAAASDANPNQTLQWSLAGGLDESLFSIDSTTGDLSFINPAVAGSYSVNIRVDDQFGGSDIQELTITAEGTPPDAVDDGTFETERDTSIVFSGSALLQNDSDLQDGPLSFPKNFNGIVDQPLNGTLSDNGNGTFTYTPNGGFVGTDSFTYSVIDSEGMTDTATVQLNITLPQVDLTITEDDKAPIIVPTTGLPAGAFIVSAAITNVSTSNTEITNLTYNTYNLANVSVNENGQLVFDLEEFFGVHDIDALKPDEFADFTISYELDDSSSHTAHVRVTGTEDSPEFVFFHDVYPVLENSTLVGHYKLFDPDSDLGPVTYELVQDDADDFPSDTALFTLSASGQLSFTAPPDYENPLDTNLDNQYLINAKAIYNGGAAEALFNFLPIPVGDVVENGNAAPIAQNDTITLQEDGTILYDLLGNDTDADGDALTITGVGIASSLAGQVFVGIENNQIRVTPSANWNGSFSFNYTISDGQGGSSTANVNVDVESVSDRPSAQDRTITVDEDTARTLVVADFGFSDPNDLNEFVSIYVSALPSAGTLTLDGNSVAPNQNISVADISAGKLQWTPPLNANGDALAGFSFQVVDNGSNANGGGFVSTAAEIIFNVLPVDDAPVADSLSLNAPEDSPYIKVTLSADPVETSEFIQFFTIGSLPANGVLFSDSTLQNPVFLGQRLSSSTGQLDLYFRPDANFHGQVSFDFTATEAVVGPGSTVSSVNMAQDYFLTIAGLNGGGTVRGYEGAFEVSDFSFDVSAVVSAATGGGASAGRPTAEPLRIALPEGLALTGVLQKLVTGQHIPALQLEGVTVGGDSAPRTVYDLRLSDVIVTKVTDTNGVDHLEFSYGAMSLTTTPMTAQGTTGTPQTFSWNVAANTTGTTQLPEAVAGAGLTNNMAQDYFLTIAGLNGGGTVRGYEGAFEVSDFSFDVSAVVSAATGGGASAGRPTAEPLRIALPEGLALTGVLQKLVTGQHIPALQLEGVTVGGDSAPRTVYDLRLSDVIVTKVTDTNGVDHLEFSYGAMSLTTTPMTAQGTTGTPQTFSWNVAANTTGTTQLPEAVAGAGLTNNMAQDYFLTIAGLNGGGTVRGYEGAFEVSDFSFDVSAVVSAATGGGASAGRPTAEPLRIALPEGLALTGVLQKLVTGQHIPALQLEGVTVGGDSAPRTVYDLRLSDVIVTKVTDTNGVDHLEFSYGAMSLTTTPMTAQGTTGTPQTFSWNVAANTTGTTQLPEAVAGAGLTNNMAQDYFLTIAGLNGGGTVRGYEGAFEVSDFSFDVSAVVSAATGGGASAGRPTAEPLRIALPEGLALTGVLQKLVTGQHIPALQLEGVTVGGDSAPRTVYDLRLSDVIVTKVTDTNGVDHLEFSYGAMSLTTTPMTAQGTTGTPQTFSWNVAANTTGTTQLPEAVAGAGLTNNMAQDYFLTIAGLNGGGTVRGYEGAFEVSDFSFDVSAVVSAATGGGASAGRPTAEPLRIALPEGLALTGVLQKLVTGQHIPALQLEGVTVGGDSAPRTVYDLRLSDVIVTKVTDTNGVDHLEFSYGAMSLTTTPMTAQGTTGTPQTFSWNVAANTTGTTQLPEAVAGAGLTNNMAQDYFLTIAGLNGGGTVRGYEGAFEVSDFSFDVSAVVSAATGGGASAGRPTAEPLRIALPEGLALTGVLQKLVTGQHIPALQLEGVTVGGDSAPRTVYDLRLSDVIVTKVTDTNGVDHLEFSYGAMSLTTTPMTAQGTTGTPQTFSWNVAANTTGTTQLPEASSGVTLQTGLTSDPATVTIEISPINDAPSASFPASGFQAIEQESVTLSNGSIIISDADAGSGIMGVSLQVGEGDLSINVGTNAVTVFPPATPGGLFGLNGTLAAINAVLAGLNGASISYANSSDTPSTSTSLQIGINDFGNSGAGGAQGVFVNVPIAITAVNDGPVANADLNVVVEEDASILVDVLANDSDAEGDALTLTGIGIAPALAGQISVAIENNQIRVIPAPNVNGSFAFNYTVSDGQGGSSTANVNVFVQSVNDAPIAADDQTFTGDEDTAINSNLLASDVDFNTLSFTVVTGPSHGTLNLAANGQFTFDPTTNFNGHDSFTYQVDDGFGGIITRNAKLDVSAVNDIAVANDDLNVVMQEDASILVDVLANDSDADGDALTITGIGIAPALAGQIFVAIENNQIRVTPAPNINGSFSFNYTVSDGHGGTSTANVSVDVQNVNDAPVVAASLIDRSSPEDAPFNFTLPADSFGDVDFDPLSLSATLGDGTALPAWLAFNAATRSFSGTPPLNFNGFLDVRVTASDGTLVASDVFRLTITPVNDAPTDIQLSGTSIAENSANGTAIGTLSFSDPDFGDSVVYSLVAGVGAADNGLVSIVGNQVRVNGAIDFEANSTLDLRVRATDSGGLFVEKSFIVAVADIVEGPALNVINAAAGQFSVTGTNGNDQIIVGPSNLLVNAGDGNDTITLTPSANNFIHYFNGGAGNDTLDLSLMTNRVSVDLGSGVSQGQQIGLIIANSIENAVGGSGNDTLVGNNGANQLNGGLGNDSISGARGSDALIGGGGSDTFIFDDNDSGVGPGGRDQILDFIQGIDRLDIRQIDANVARGSDQAFSASISFWNGVGNEFAANSAGTIKYHYETILGVQHTIIDLNNDADRAADIQIALVGTYTFNNTSDFLL